MDTITDSKGRVACPASFEHANLLTDYKIHYASPSQIAKYGICRKCRARMKKSGKAILNGKTETPAVFEHRHDLTPEDHAGSVAPGDVVQTVDFNFDDVDIALGLVEAATPDAKQEAAELFGRIMAWTFRPPVNLRIATARWATICAGIRPDVLNDRTLAELGHEIGLTKQDMSKHGRSFQDVFGFKFSRSRSEQACAKMRARRLGGPDRHVTRMPKRAGRPT